MDLQTAKVTIDGTLAPSSSGTVNVDISSKSIAFTVSYLSDFFKHMYDLKTSEIKSMVVETPDYTYTATDVIYPHDLVQQYSMRLTSITLKASTLVQG